MTEGVAWGFLWGLGLWVLNLRLKFRTEGSESEFQVKASGFKVKV